MSEFDELVKKTLFFIAQKGWTNDNKAFCDSVAIFLSKNIGLSYVIIGMLPSENYVETISFVEFGEVKANFKYPLIHTPCENVIGRNLCCYEKNVQKIFPKDTMLVDMQAESYIGIPLWDVSGAPIGLIALLDDKPIENPSEIETILQIVAVRVAHEIERSNYEKELIEKNKKLEETDKLKSAFLANMSHEIRTPMNGILGFSNLLKRPGLSGETQQEYIRLIEKSGTRMLNIIQEIVDISKIESGLMKVNIIETNVNENMEYVYTLLKLDSDQKKLQLSFTKSLNDAKAMVKTDKEKLIGILTNIVKNAIKYTDKGSVEFGYTVNDGFLEFYVKDTGIGIPRDRQTAIFDRFIQADISDIEARQGAGLGLSISKAFIEMLGGKIWVESEVGKGTTFYFTIQYHPSFETDSIFIDDSNSLKEDYINERLKILIVEDDETSQDLISIMVENFAKEILKARTGVEAVETCKMNTDIDLILMDIKMPEMSGYEAVGKIREFNKNVVIIAQTALALAGDREKAIKNGCDDYISKPLKKDELNAMIQQYSKKYS